MATVTLTVEGRVPGALSTDRSWVPLLPPLPRQPHEQMTPHHQGRLHHSEVTVRFLLPLFLSWELSWRGSWVRNPTILTANSRHDSCKLFSVQGGLTATRGERSSNTLQSTVLLGNSKTFPFSPLPSHHSPTVSSMPNRHKASNPGLAMKLRAVTLRSGPWRCWRKLHLRASRA